MKSIYLVTAVLLAASTNSSLAQGTWTRKADFPGMSGSLEIAFSVGEKGYMGIGRNNDLINSNKEFWEYDPSTNAWSQKSDFGGHARHSAVGFAIGKKGYVGTGRYNFSTGGAVDYKDFWEYDPATNSWTQKTDFGGAARFAAMGFSVGNKGYLGTGNNGINLNDFWEYDQQTDKWIRKADFGGGVRNYGTSFSIGSKGYFGTGGDDFGSKNDFWEYDPSIDNWSQKSNFGGLPRSGAFGFSIGTKGYIGTGSNGTPDFWEYDPLADSWTSKATFSELTRREARGFSIGDKGYMGTGVKGSFTSARDFWEYFPGSPISKQYVADFTLVDADLDKDISPISDGSVIDLRYLPTNKLNIRANTSPGKVGSVVFALDGQNVRTENGVPYAFAGDLPSGDYHSMILPLGSHTLAATPYSDYNGRGTAGTPLTINFTMPVMIQSATLVNAVTDEDIQDLSTRDVIVLNMLPTDQLNIRINTSPKRVDSVEFFLDGSRVRTEKSLPYTLGGDKAGVDYLPMTFSIGTHSLTLIPYASYNGIPFRGVTDKIDFFVSDGQASLCNGKPYDPRYQICTSCGVIDQYYEACTPCGIINPQYEKCVEPCGLISVDQSCCPYDSTAYATGAEECTECGVSHGTGVEKCTPCGYVDISRPDLHEECCLLSLTIYDTLTEKCTPCGIIPIDAVCDKTVTTAAPERLNMLDEAPAIRLSPNPVHTNLTVRITGQNKDTELYILSSSGVVVKRTRVANTNRLSLDVSGLPNGNYFIKLVSGNTVTHRQFVKM